MPIRSPPTLPTKSMPKAQVKLKVVIPALLLLLVCINLHVVKILDEHLRPELVQTQRRKKFVRKLLETTERTATGQDIAYSLAHPTKFRLDTPNAPSCSLPLNASSISFTLVTQLSNDRMWMIPYHCKRWGNNPISVVVFSNRDATEVKENAVKEAAPKSS